MNTLKQSKPGKRKVLVTAKNCRNGRANPGISPEIVRMAQSQAQHRSEQRHSMISEAAYLRAERRGFTPGHELDDWLAAELEVQAAQRLSVLCPADAVTPAYRANWEQ